MAQEIADSTLLDTWSSSGLIVKPDISKIIEGWQLGEQPPHEYMNWLQNTFGSKLNHILKNGIAGWNNTTQYLAGSSVQHNGNVWLCKTTNTNSEPTDVNSNWKRIITVESLTTVLGGYVALTGNQTIAGIKTFTSPINVTTTTNTYEGAGLTTYGNGAPNGILPSIAFHQPGLFAGSLAMTSTGLFSFFQGDGTTKAFVDADLAGNAATVTNGVYTTGDQTIAGVKTFSASPIVPTPTTGTQAVNKDYADLKVALESFTGANQGLASSGYQKLPGGLIIQWGTVAIPAGSQTTANFPISFPNSVFRYSIAPNGNSATGGLDYGVNITNTQITLGTAFSTGTSSPGYIAIGY